MPVRILYSAYAVDVYGESGGFAGGITRRRMDSREAPYLVAHALEEILNALGIVADVAEDRHNGGEPYRHPERAL